MGLVSPHEPTPSNQRYKPTLLTVYSLEGVDVGERELESQEVVVVALGGCRPSRWLSVGSSSPPPEIQNTEYGIRVTEILMNS